MTASFNVAVLGFGLSAKVFMIPFIRATPRLNLYAIVQRSPTPDNDAARSFPETNVFRSYSEMLADAKVDLVVIATGVHTHYELTKLALEHGKNGNEHHYQTNVGFPY